MHRKGRLSESASVVLDGLSARASSAEAPRSPESRLEKSGNYAESLVTMKTRIAVRDQTPHRFQTIPLRDVKDLGVNLPKRFTTPSTPGNFSLPDNLGLYLNEKSLPLPINNLRKEKPQRQTVDAGQYNPSTTNNATISELTCPFFYRGSGIGVLAETDLNQDLTMNPGLSLTSSKNCGLLSMVSSSVKNASHLTHVFPRTLHKAFRTGGKHRTLAAFGSTNVSEISQLFCSEASESQPVRRRNRSLTVTTIRSDASVSDPVEVEAKLKRRHAIYRESLTPCQDQSNYFFGNVAVSESRSSSPSHCSSVGIMPNQHRGEHRVEDNPKALQDPFELKPSKTKVFPAAKFIAKHMNPNGPILATRPLQTRNAMKAGKSDKTVRTDICGDIVYPPIILDLFQDIDDAIHDWNRI